MLSKERHQTATGPERIRAGVAATKALGRPFVFCARADGWLNKTYDAEEALRRIAAFDAAGADLLYAPGLKEPELARMVAATEAPVNALAAGRASGISRAGYAKMGVARISVGAALARRTQKTLVDDRVRCWTAAILPPWHLRARIWTRCWLQARADHGKRLPAGRGLQFRTCAPLCDLGEEGHVARQPATHHVLFGHGPAVSPVMCDRVGGILQEAGLQHFGLVHAPVLHRPLARPIPFPFPESAGHIGGLIAKPLETGADAQPLVIRLDPEIQRMAKRPDRRRITLRGCLAGGCPISQSLLAIAMGCAISSGWYTLLSVFGSITPFARSCAAARRRLLGITAVIFAGYGAALAHEAATEA